MSKQPHHMHPVERLIAGISDSPILQKFIGAKREEFETFQQREHAKQNAVVLLGTLKEQVKRQRKMESDLLFKLDEYCAQDEVEVVLDGVVHGVGYLPNMRERVAMIRFAKDYRKPLLERVQQRVAQAEAELERHIQKNAEFLREAGVEL